MTTTDLPTPPPRRRHRVGHHLRTVFIAIGALVVFAIVAGVIVASTSTNGPGRIQAATTPAPATSASDTPATNPPTTAPSAASVGAPIRGEGTDLNGQPFTETITVNKLGTYPGDGYSPPSAGDQFATANITITCVSGSCLYNQLYFTLQTADGSVWNPAFGQAPEPEIEDGTLAGGQTLRGNVGWQIPKAATTVKVQWEDLTNSLVGEWQGAL